MAAAPNSSDYPNFAELCRQARDMEKMLLEVQPSQLSGTFGPDEANALFPKEFENYTFSYMLGEATKVERNIFASHYQSSVAPGAGADAKPERFDQKVSDELREFVSKDMLGGSSFPRFGQKKSQESAPPKPPAKQAKAVLPLTIPVPSQPPPGADDSKARWPTPTQVQKAAPLPPPPSPPAGGDEGKEPYEVEDFEKGNAAAKAKPPQPPQEKGQASAGTIPEEEEEPLPMPEENEAPLPEPGEEAKPEEGARQEPDSSAQAPKRILPPKSLPEKEGEWVEPEQEKAAAAAPVPEEPRKSAASSLSSSSKISPRLRAIIEEKLRRDEENERREKAQEIDASFEREVTPEAPREDEQDISLSSRERLLKKLEKNYPKQKMASEDFLEGEREVAQEEHEAGEEPAAKDAKEEGDVWEEPNPPLKKKAQPEGEAEEAESPSPRPVFPHEEEMKPEAETGEAKPEAEVPMQQKLREGYARPTSMDKGGVLIQPIFSEDAGPGKPLKPVSGEAPQQQPEDARLQKIQRIIDELSPDKFKAAASAPVEEEQLPSAAKAKARPKSFEINENFSFIGDERTKAATKAAAPQAEEEEEAKPKASPPAVKKAPVAEPEEAQPKPAAKKVSVLRAEEPQKPAARKAPARAPQKEEPEEEEKPAPKMLARKMPARATPEEEKEPGVAKSISKSPAKQPAAVLPKKAGAKKPAGKGGKAQEQAVAQSLSAKQKGKQPAQIPVSPPVAQKKGAKQQVKKEAAKQIPAKPVEAPAPEEEGEGEREEKPAPKFAAKKSLVRATPKSALEEEKAQPRKAQAEPDAEEVPKKPFLRPSFAKQKAAPEEEEEAPAKPVPKPKAKLEEEEAIPPRTLPSAIQLKTPAPVKRQAIPQEKDDDAGPAEPSGQQKSQPSLARRQLPNKAPAGSGTGTASSQPQVPPYANDTSAVPTSPSKPGARVLPGGVTVPSSYQQTYLPPARQRTLPMRPQASAQREAPPEGEEKKPSRVLPGKSAIGKPEPGQEEKTPEEFEQEKLRATTAESLKKKLLAARQDDSQKPVSAPKKQDADEVPAPSGDDAAPLPPNEEESENKAENAEGKSSEGKPEKQKSALPARPFEQSSREISGEAALPDKNKDDELDVPAPDADDKPPEPAPGDYADAKEQLKRKIANEGLKEDIRAESEETLEQYAKENMIWLYEIYKMGGLTREDFIEKVKEQAHGAGQQADPKAGGEEHPPNPALESLNRELDKKAKK